MSTIPSRPQGLIPPTIEEFRTAIQDGRRPRLEDILPATEPDRSAVCAELAAVEIDCRIRAGDDASAAEYFARFPDLRSDPTLALRLVQAELRARMAIDPGTSESSFRERYPDLAGHPDWSSNQLVTTPQIGTTPFRPSGETKSDGPSIGPSDPMEFLRMRLDPPDRPGDLGRFGDFRIARVLGAGGMGFVLDATDSNLNRRVALKLMRPEVAERRTARERFLREARAMAAVEHPRVVVVHAVGERSGVPYLVMPLMAGQSLAKRLKSGPVPLPEALRLARETADGLAAAHSKGVIHRDVKPDNIWLEDTAEGTHVRILDFGLARDDGAEPLTQSGAIFGTPAYMAPEQAAGEKVDGRADIFSLGCVLYELLTGQRAFAGPSMTAILFALANHTPPSARTVNPAVPDALSAYVDRLLAKSRTARPGSAAEVAAALRDFESGNAPPTIDWKPAAKKSPRTLTIGCTLTLTLCLVVGVGLISQLGQNANSSFTHVGSALPPTNSKSPKGVDTVLSIQSLDLLHYRPTADRDLPKGTIGQDSFDVAFGDKVQIRAVLSKAAHAYLLAFRPDGVVELCYPESEDLAPPPSALPRYPLTDDGKAYGLTDGTGLWVFAIVASDKPLPPYRDWIAKNPVEWKTRNAPGETVWRHDGSRLEPKLPTGGTRAKGSTIDDAAGDAIRAVVRDLGRSGATVAALGFGVRPK
jgi:serine/threonine protein kinase